MEKFSQMVVISDHVFYNKTLSFKLKWSTRCMRETILYAFAKWNVLSLSLKMQNYY